MKWSLVKRAGDTLVNPDGTVRSWNPPDGHWETRPAGTAGAYELATFSGGFVAYNPTGNAVTVFGWMPNVPNRPGFGAITETPLT